ncbi:MAG: ATP-binding protein [Acidobacteriota bacterium]
MRYRFGDATLDKRAGVLTRDGRAVPLEPRTFQVLCALVDRAGELVEHQTLIDLVWGGLFVTPHSLTEAISQLRRTLGDDPRAPRVIETAPRRGYRFVAPRERLADDGPPRWRMPARLVDLIGRSVEIEDTVSRLASARLLTIVGPGGVGKTQLALEAARRIETIFADGAVLIDLAPATTPADVDRIVANAAHVPERHNADIALSIGSVLRDTNALLVLDNCERVADAAGRLTDAILGAAPGIRVLATSQRPLGATSESLLRLAPLACSAVDGPDSPSPAAQLFAARVAAVQPGSELLERDASAVVQICQRLDGLPLAIELAAAQARVLSLPQILERLDSRFELLGRSRPAAANRHRSLSAMLEWSASLLDPGEMRFLEHVAVFPAGWTLDAAAAVMGRPQDAGAFLPPLTGLVDKSLVLADTTRESARYHLLDSIRLFARARLDHPKPNPVARNRMLDYYVDMTDRAGRKWYTTSGYQWLDHLREEWPNVRAALEWALATPDRADLGLRLAGNLHWFWRDDGNFIESRSWLSRTLAAASDGAGARGRAEVALGHFLHHATDFDSARDVLERGVRQLRDAAAEDLPWALSLKAMNEAVRGDATSCAEAAKTALHLAEDLHLDRVGAQALLGLGLSHAVRGDHVMAVQEMTSAWQRVASTGDSFLETYISVNLGLQRLLVGDSTGSRKLLSHSLILSRQLRNLRAMAGCFEGLGYLAASDGREEFGARLMGAAARIREITGTPHFPQWLTAHDVHRRLIESKLGQASAEIARSAGAATPVDELAVIALS